MVKWINYIPFKGNWDDIEKKLGCSVDNDLKKVVEKYNKGMPDKKTFKIKNGKEVMFDVLISYNYDTKTNVFSCMNEYMRENHLIPFGYNMYGTLICIKNSKVVLYKSENNLELEVAPSFKAFINLLY